MKIKIIAALIILIPATLIAQNNIAIQNYLQGEYSAALDGLTRLSQNNNTEAMFDLGQMYLYGQGVTKDSAKAYQLIQQAATRNYVPAQLFLARMDLIQRNDVDSALVWFQKAAALGDVSAQMFCATSYLYGYGVPRDVEKARKLVIKAAQAGDPLAQYELAKLFFNSKSPKDQALAGLWLTKSAAQGNAQAQNQLGMMLLTGAKISKDVPKAIELLKKSAEQQNAKSGLVLFSYALSMPDSIQKAIDITYWLNKSAQILSVTTDLNTVDAAVPLYFMKSLQAKNAKAPLTFDQWLTLAKQGDINAARQVGFMYSTGQGTTENQQAAIGWLARASINNNYIAKIQLAATQARWENNKALEQSTILTPKLVQLDKDQIFNTNYQLQDPNSLPATEIIQALGRLNYDNSKTKFTIPNYLIPEAKEVLALSDVNETMREAYYGYPIAQYKLGLLFQQGIGMKKNIQEAIKWYQLSAGKNYSKAEYALGILALTGTGMNKDFKVATNWLTQAAFHGDVNAQLLFARFYEMGYGKNTTENHFQKNLNLAKVMYGAAATNDNAEAQYDLAQLYLSGLLDPNDYKKQQNYLKQAYALLKQASKSLPKAKLAVAYFYLNKNVSIKDQQWAFNIATQLAAKGNQQAQLLLALMYDRGIGTQTDSNAAINIYRKLANNSNPIALYMLGSKFGLGDGLTKSSTLARDYLTQATSANVGFANYNLAVLDYQQGDTESFTDLLKQARNQGYPAASILLADYYLTLQGSPDDLQMAIGIYNNLANGGDVEAQIKLAYMYQHGIYFNTDYQMALNWYQKAADNNNALAQYALGEMYQLGQGTDRDLSLAMTWYGKAAQQQYAPAQTAMGYIQDVDLQNYGQARLWYELAATNGKNAIATYNLALMYEYGKGMPTNIEKAKSLYQLVVDKFRTSDLSSEQSTLSLNTEQVPFSIGSANHFMLEFSNLSV